MIEKFRKNAGRHLVRPTIYMASTRFLLALTLVLLLDRFTGTKSASDIKMFGFVFSGVFFALLAWIAYLRFDGMHMPKLLMKRVNIRKKPQRSYGDMIDYIEEEPVSFDELEDEEKDICCFFADLICCVLFVALSFL